MTINVNTKIGAIIKHEPRALEAIVSISPKFTKLRNPILRKVIAARATIAMASKIGGCQPNDFFNKLSPLGFEIDGAAVVNNERMTESVPSFLKQIPASKLMELDVRPVIEGGKDPLNIILQHVKSLPAGQVLKIINSFEPTPLIHLLGKKGFDSHVEWISDEVVETYFYKKEGASDNLAGAVTSSAEGWDQAVQRFEGRMQTIDVRELQMPQPMHNILEALKKLSSDKALFVYHKRIPVFLLPELEERKFAYLIREISEQEVHLLIYKD